MRRRVDRRHPVRSVEKSSLRSRRSMSPAAVAIRKSSHNRLDARVVRAMVANRGRRRNERCATIFSAPVTLLTRVAPVDPPTQPLRGTYQCPIKSRNRPMSHSPIAVASLRRSYGRASHLPFTRTTSACPEYRRRRVDWC